MAPADGSADSQEILYGLHAVREALKAGGRPLQRVLVLRTDKQFTDLVQLARSHRVPVHIQPISSLDRLVPNGKHQGVVALAAAKAYQTQEEILDRAAQRQEPPLLVILDGVEDPHNLGAVLRTAEGAGAHGVFIPERRAAGLTSVVAKASAGAIDPATMNVQAIAAMTRRSAATIAGQRRRAIAELPARRSQGRCGAAIMGRGMTRRGASPRACRRARRQRFRDDDRRRGRGLTPRWPPPGR